MKYFAILILVIISTSANSSSIGNKQCSAGITNWCQTVMSAKKCNAVDFCIQTVWTKHLVQIDSNPLCNDCKEWVERAREALARKGTFDQIIGTLEWSCSLCPNENGRDRCKTIIEDNVHEIQKILVSEMNPDAVCSAIHLCNNPAFTEMFENHEKQPAPKPKIPLLPFTCGQCNHIAGLIENKAKSADNDEMLEGILSVCGQISSFSDACSTLVLRNFNEIKVALPKFVNKQKMCHATCSRHNSFNNEGIVDIQPAFDDPDIPCELCQQLMIHLRELLIVNTTKVEFKNMLDGFCEQMGSIKDECDEIVDEYYDTIYSFLENGLDADKTCTMIKMCQPPSNEFKPPKMPLLSGDLFPKPGVDEDAVEIIINNDNSLKLVKNGALCTACEYTMQLIHREIEKNTVHNKILESAKAQCKKLPQYIRQCEDLIDMFGDQIIEAVDVGTNPRLVCPLIKMCPASSDFKFITSSKQVDEKPTCPFCLFAMQEIKEVVSQNSTKDSILSVLNGLCTHLSVNLQPECKEFVKTYSAEVVDMILADFTPQQACVFIRLCSNNEPKFEKIKLPESFGDSSDSDEFIDLDESSVEKSSKIRDNPQCQLCKSVIELIEQRVIDIKSKDEIRRELENSCSRLRKFSKECKAFVDKYSDRIVDLVSQELKPEKICQELLFCVTEDQADMQDYDFGLDILAGSFNIPSKNIEEVDASSTTCIICEFIMTKAEEELNDKQMDEDIKKIFKNICSKMPQTVSKQCNQFIDYYFDMIIALIETTKPEEMCTVMKLCPKMDGLIETKLLEIKNDIYSCAVCKGVVEAVDTIIEDPQIDTNLENLEEKICEKFAGKFKDKCHNLASTYGVAIINLLKNMTESDQICFKLDLCQMSGGASGMVKLL